MQAMQCKLYNATGSFYIKVILHLRQDLSSGFDTLGKQEVKADGKQIAPYPGMMSNLQS